jgi:hypothetical protein
VIAAALRQTAAWLVAAAALCGCDPEVVVGRLPAMQNGHADAGMDSGADANTAADTGTATGTDANTATDTGMEADASMDAGMPPEPPVTWLTGAHSGNDLPEYVDFGAWRGRPLGLAAVYPDRSSWATMTMPTWPVDMFKDFPGKLLMSMPLYPEGIGNNQDCKNGAYDADWKQFGQFMVDRDRASAIIRLGWGWNDNDHPWKADADPSDWIACFQRVVTAIRATAPDIQIDWSFNPVGPPEIRAGDPYTAYPGDDYVDFIGLEEFDMYPAVHDDATWEQKCNGASGLCHLAEFARAHGKKVGIAEWGIATCGGDPGGDNPFFVRKVFETFARYTDLMGYEAYFVDGDAEVCSTIEDDPDATQAAAEYKKLYGPR